MADATCWTLIEGAAAGDAAARGEFATRYHPIVRSYLKARWQRRAADGDLEDAVQEVFLECLRSGGMLERFEQDRGHSFRSFLYGVVRNVARRFESDAARRVSIPSSEAFEADAVALDETSLTAVFDRVWAKAILREASARQARAADRAGPASVRRVELLRQVFQEGVSIAELARRWGVDEDALRYDYRCAREEFLSSLMDVVAFHHPHHPELVARECRELAAYFG